MSDQSFLNHFGGVRIVEVAAGTEIVDPKTGNKAVVDDEHGVHLNGVMYLTAKNFEALKRAVPAKDSE